MLAALTGPFLYVVKSSLPVDESTRAVDMAAKSTEEEVVVLNLREAVSFVVVALFWIIKATSPLPFAFEI